MKTIALMTVLITVFGIVLLPAFLARGCDFLRQQYPRPYGKIPVPVALYRHGSQTLVKMDLEEYLVGVLAAEAPASFDVEALKAQATVSRTYAVKRMCAFGGKGSECHPSADICDDPAHGQGYLSEQDALAKWGVVSARRNWTKLCGAVSDTSGLIVTYKGIPAWLNYHSTCGGRTESAEDVWGDQIPYLVSVECTWCKASPRFRTAVEMSLDDLAARLGDRSGAIPVMARKDGRKLIEILKSSATGRVQQLKVGNVTAKGTEFRSALGLPSTRFGWQVNGSKIKFECQGYGHGVGLCQYGANGMAQDGYLAEQIIAHYFTGARVVPMFDTR